MRVRRNTTKRWVSMLLCVAMLLTCVPAVTTAAADTGTNAGSQTVDADTLDQWKNFFGVQTDDPNNVSLTTEFAGSV